jgi:hypothetical protein
MKINRLHQAMFLIFIDFFSSGCLTTKVNDMVYPMPVPDKLIKIENAILNNQGDLCINLIANQKNKKKDIHFKLEFNLDSVIQKYKPYISDELTYLPDEDALKTGVHSLYYLKDSSTCFILIKFRRHLVINEISETNCLNNGEDILNKLNLTEPHVSIHNNYGKDQIIITYLPDLKQTNYIAFTIPNSTQRKKVPYLLYPFAIILDVITLPVQIIKMARSYGKIFKS